MPSTLHFVPPETITFSTSTLDRFQAIGLEYSHPPLWRLETSVRDRVKFYVLINTNLIFEPT